MITEQEPRIKYSFSGHESFQCRQLWLKKGFDYIKDGKSFNSEDAVVDLGVGKNMVASIRYWLKAFNIIDANDSITEFGNALLDNNGFDPFLEDDASLWLLHYQLVKSGIASTNSLIFNEFRREKVQFNKESYTTYIKRKSETEKDLKVNPKTIGDDFDVFRKMYLSSKEDGQNIEDSFSGLLTELDLVKSFIHLIEESGKKKKEEVFYIENLKRPTLPVEILLYMIRQNYSGLSISLNSLENDFNSPGAICALSREGLVNKINEAVEEYNFITYIDQAGVKELQFREDKSPLELLRIYYAK